MMHQHASGPKIFLYRLSPCFNALMPESTGFGKDQYANLFLWHLRVMTVTAARHTEYQNNQYELSCKMTREWIFHLHIWIVLM